MPNFLTHILSGHFLQLIVIFYNHNICFVEQGAWKKVALLFNGASTRRSIVCMLFLCRCFNVRHWSAIGLLTKSAFFFLGPAFINSVFSQYKGVYVQWITTQNVRKKIRHAMHSKWKILIKYFSSYIKKYQTDTYFFGWVYITPRQYPCRLGVFNRTPGGGGGALTFWRIGVCGPKIWNHTLKNWSCLWTEGLKN